MTIGRIFPIPAPGRVFPIDPTLHGQTDRNAPLPFQGGVGSQNTIERTATVGFILQRIITQLGTLPPGTGGGGVSVSCNPITNLYCVPQATVTKATAPTAVIRCAN
jgi:hypothetical protein